MGPWITEHPGIQKIAFTGSTATGRRVMQSAAVNLKRVTLELGGNDPAIVLPDVDVKERRRRCFGERSGIRRRCALRRNVFMCIRIFTTRSAKALVEYAKTVKMGDGASEGTGLGPIQNRPQFQKVKELIASAKNQGLSFLREAKNTRGAAILCRLTIIDNPPEDSRVVAEEAFGPVLPLLKYRDTDDAVKRANNSEYGLGATVWGKDLAKAKAVADRLECGTVWLNSGPILSPNAPFGGHKQSGIGVEHATDGLLEYTNVQTIVS